MDGTDLHRCRHVQAAGSNRLTSQVELRACSRSWAVCRRSQASAVPPKACSSRTARSAVIRSRPSHNAERYCSSTFRCMAASATERSNGSKQSTSTVRLGEVGSSSASSRSNRRSNGSQAIRHRAHALPQTGTSSADCHSHRLPNARPGRPSVSAVGARRRPCPAALLPCPTVAAARGSCADAAAEHRSGHPAHTVGASHDAGSERSPSEPIPTSCRPHDTSRST